MFWTQLDYLDMIKQTTKKHVFDENIIKNHQSKEPGKLMKIEFLHKIISPKGHYDRVLQQEDEITVEEFIYNNAEFVNNKINAKNAKNKIA